MNHKFLRLAKYSFSPSIILFWTFEKETTDHSVKHALSGSACPSVSDFVYFLLFALIPPQKIYYHQTGNTFNCSHSTSFPFLFLFKYFSLFSSLLYEACRMKPCKTCLISKIVQSLSQTIWPWTTHYEFHYELIQFYGRHVFLLFDQFIRHWSERSQSVKRSSQTKCKEKAEKDILTQIIIIIYKYINLV